MGKKIFTILRSKILTYCQSVSLTPNSLEDTRTNDLRLHKDYALFCSDMDETFHSALHHQQEVSDSSFLIVPNLSKNVVIYPPSPSLLKYESQYLNKWWWVHSTSFFLLLQNSDGRGILLLLLCVDALHPSQQFFSHV